MNNLVHVEDAMNCKNAVLVGALFLLPGQFAQAESPSKLDQMISPISNPINFEDPRIKTELHPFFAYHDLNNDFVTEGGEVTAWAAQARIALTDRLALIATKDGYMNFSPKKALDDSDGSLNLEGGLKYALFVDENEGQIFSTGLKYQVATGDPDVFQGQGDGLLIPFVSGGASVGGMNLLASTQLRVAMDSDDSSFWDMSVHADYPIDNFYPLIELNLFHVYDAGKRLPIGGEGDDLLDLGASGADSATTLNMAVGARYRIADWCDVGVAFEFPLANDEGVFGNRLYVDAVFTLPDWTLMDSLS